jgi:hypothetical protein
MGSVRSLRTSAACRGLAHEAHHARVLAQDQSLLLLQPLNLTDNGRFPPGSIAQNERHRVLIFGGAHGKLFGAVLDQAGLGAGPPRLAEASSVLALDPDSHDSSLTRQPPRDHERQVIMQGHATLVTSIDAMVPIGVGQSMLFFDEPGWLFRDAYRYLPSLHLAGPVKNVLEDDALALALGCYKACESAEALRDAGQHATLVIPDLTPLRRVWMRAMFLQHLHSGRAGPAPATDRGELRQFYTGLVQRAARLAEAQGGGSLTLLARIPRQSSKPRVAAPLQQQQQQQFLLDAFEQEAKQGTGASRSTLAERLTGAARQASARRRISCGWCGSPGAASPSPWRCSRG